MSGIWTYRVWTQAWVRDFGEENLDNAFRTIFAIISLFGPVGILIAYFVTQQSEDDKVAR